MKPLKLVPPIHRATHRIELYLEGLGELGVTQAEAHILAHLAAYGDSTVAELHGAFGHKRSTLTSILDRLERRGLATREVSSSDRRTFRVVLSETGRSLATRVHDGLAAFEARVLDAFPEERLRNLLELLSAVENAAVESASPTAAAAEAGSG